MYNIHVKLPTFMFTVCHLSNIRNAEPNRTGCMCCAISNEYWFRLILFPLPSKTTFMPLLMKGSYKDNLQVVYLSYFKALIFAN